MSQEKEAVTKRNRANKRAGAKWQATIRNGLREEAFDVEELKLTGAQDEGDLVIRWGDGEYTVVEAKAGVMHAADFVRQARTEGKHFADHRGLPREDVDSIVIVKRKGASWKDAYVLTTVREYFGLEDG